MGQHSGRRARRHPRTQHPRHLVPARHARLELLPSTTTQLIRGEARMSPGRALVRPGFLRFHARFSAPISINRTAGCSYRVWLPGFYCPRSRRLVTAPRRLPEWRPTTNRIRTLLRSGPCAWAGWCIGGRAMQVRIHGGPLDGQTRFVPAPSRLLVLKFNRALLDEEDVRRLGPALAGYTAVYQ